ncbi:IS3 family transposase [Anoxybacteroides rupiense]|uniref:IS3 family transposase n=2 Tax=Anoxybacteroides rupiense TaxID=311460 RepID=UPI0030B81B05
MDFSDSQITISRQAELLSINRSSVYRQPPKEKVISDDDLFIMRRIDELHTVHPTWSYRTITKVIRRDDHILVNRQKIRRLMREMGMHTIYPKPHLSKRYHAQYIRPYLLRKLNSCRPDQVWGIDITYLRMEKGVMYLFVIIDWCSRCIVDYELSSTLEKTFVMNCLERALKSRKPEIMNRDQGSHFTNPDYLGLLDRAEIKVSMDGKGQALDNVRTERFFRTLKYDLIYPQEFETPRQLRKGITEYIHEYNTYRPHSSIGDLCPLEAYNGREFCAA